MSREDGGRDHGLCERCSSAPCLCMRARVARHQAPWPRPEREPVLPEPPPADLSEAIERAMDRINPMIERAERALTVFCVAGAVPLSADRALRFSKHDRDWRLTTEPDGRFLITASRATRLEALSRLPALIDELRVVTEQQLGTITTILMAAGEVLDDLEKAHD